jgi:hypothetical protein
VATTAGRRRIVDGHQDARTPHPAGARDQQHAAGGFADDVADHLADHHPGQETVLAATAGDDQVRAQGAGGCDDFAIGLVAAADVDVDRHGRSTGRGA